MLSVLVQEGGDRLAEIDNRGGDREAESLLFGIFVYSVQLYCGAGLQAVYFEFCSLAVYQVNRTVK